MKDYSIRLARTIFIFNVIVVVLYLLGAGVYSSDYKNIPYRKMDTPTGVSIVIESSNLKDKTIFIKLSKENLGLREIDLKAKENVMVDIKNLGNIQWIGCRLHNGRSNNKTLKGRYYVEQGIALIPVAISNKGNECSINIVYGSFKNKVKLKGFSIVYDAKGEVFGKDIGELFIFSSIFSIIYLFSAYYLSFKSGLIPLVSLLLVIVLIVFHYIKGDEK